MVTYLENDWMPVEVISLTTTRNYVMKLHSDIISLCNFIS